MKESIHQAEPLIHLTELCNKQRRFFESGSTLSYESRKEALLKIKELITKHEEEILTALRSDLQKPAFEAYASEIGFLLQEVNYALKHLRSWMKPQKVGTGLLSMPSSSRIVHQPKGVCLIIAPWNYPFNLVIAPMIAAIAAGNTVIIKPAEHTPATAELLQSLIGKYFKPELARVILGEGAKIIPALIDEFRFDHIFFTGSMAVGKKVAVQAAGKLVPVTLELGGKNPCIVDSTADLKVAAKRLLWAKVLNAGQTCIAPDYLLVQHNVAEEFKVILVNTLKEFYPEGAMADANYSGIIDKPHLQKLVAFLQEGRIIYGGEYDEGSLRMEPCLIELDGTNHPIMESEIFGPILPIIEFSNTSEVHVIIEQNSHPLSLYYFGNDAKSEAYFKNRVLSGGMAVNNAVIHFVNSRLPFGGVGTSGYGSYHGYHGFRTFTHFKSVMRSATWLDPNLKYPPYSRLLMKVVKRLMH